MGAGRAFRENRPMNHVDFGLLVLRVVVGLSMAAHGWNKLFGGGRLPGTARWFESLGMRPGWLHARLAAFTEVGAGTMLALGLFTPLAAAGIIGVMTVAILIAHRKNGFFIFRPGEGWEYCLIMATAAFSIGTIGAGTASLDHAIGIDVDSWWGAVISAGIGLGAAAITLAACYRPPAPVAKAA
jgi:putative oxidoreductase